MILRRLFAIYEMPSPPVSSKDHENRKREMRRGAVKKSASGSLLLHKGKYSTQADIDSRKQRIFGKS